MIDYKHIIFYLADLCLWVLKILPSWILIVQTISNVSSLWVDIRNTGKLKLNDAAGVQDVFTFKTLDGQEPKRNIKYL